jgi:hypothetical protein
MNAVTIGMLAMLLVATISSGASSEDPIPYIKIEHPKDGSTVGTSVTLEAVAEGKDLRDPRYSIEGENIGYLGPLTDCVFSVSNGEDTNQGYMKMYCKQQLNLESFQEQNVRLSVSVEESSGILRDSVGLLVSGHCA